MHRGGLTETANLVAATGQSLSTSECQIRDQRRGELLSHQDATSNQKDGEQRLLGLQMRGEEYARRERRIHPTVS